MAKALDLHKVNERLFNEAFQQRLREARIARDWSQEQMAEFLGIPAANYIKYETRPKSKFPPYLYEKLAGLTGRPIEFFLTGQTRNVRLFARK